MILDLLSVAVELFDSVTEEGIEVINDFMNAKE